MAELLECTPQEYRDHPAIGQSDLKMYARDKQLYFEVKIGKTRKIKTTPVMQAGTDFESFVVAGGKFESILEPLPSNIRARRGDAYRDLCRDNPGITYLPKTLYDSTVQQRYDFHDAFKNLKRHAIAWPWLEQAEWHKRIVWDCPFTGVQRKAELDMWLPDLNVIVDLKWTADNSIDGFPGMCRNLGYHIQAATYQEAMYYLNGEGEPPRFMFLAVNNKPSFSVNVHEASPDMIAKGRERSRELLRRLQRSVENNDWHESPTNTEINMLDLPRYADWDHKESDAFYEETTG